MAPPRESSTTAPRRCPGCGKPMERGLIECKTNLGMPATIYWNGDTGLEAEELAPPPKFIWSGPPLFRAFRCTDCSRLEVFYEQFVDKPVGPGGVPP